MDKSLSSRLGRNPPDTGTLLNHHIAERMGLDRLVSYTEIERLKRWLVVSS